MKTVIVVKKDYFSCKGCDYAFNKFNSKNNILTANIKIIILEEELYSKHFFVNVKANKLSQFIEEKIDSEFQLNKDILYDYEKNKKKNIVAIYSLKGGKRIEKIIEEGKNLEIKPIQFIIKSSMQKIIGNKIRNSKALVNFDGYYYYVSLKEGLFYYGFVEKDQNRIINRIFEIENGEDIYIDNKIADEVMVVLEEKFRIIKINLGDLLNDKIYEKQKFHFRKVL